VVYGLGLRLVGCLPALPPRSGPGAGRRAVPAPAAEADWQAVLMESIGATRALLLHTSRVEALRVVMITSALEGEGKTSLAGHLATSLARAGRRTLLVDGDLRRPAVHRLFDLPPEPGLCELLRGGAGVAEALRPTQIDDLCVLPAGRAEAPALQALARGDLHLVLEELRGQFDFIIVDSAPILPVSDTLLIAQHADAVLFSILRDVSRLPMVYGACERLQALGVRVLGAVVAGADGPHYGPRYSTATKAAGIS
jgi:capsular exopolysaccharide synthesis family protein